MLSKRSYINNATIVYGRGENDSYYVRLLGSIGKHSNMFGRMYGVKESFNSGYRNLHYNIDEAYIGLGYASDMLACITRLIQTDGNKAIIIPTLGIESNYSVNFVNSITKKSGYEIHPIVYLYITHNNKRQNEIIMLRSRMLKNIQSWLADSVIADIINNLNQSDIIAKIKEYSDTTNISNNCDIIYNKENISIGMSCGYIIKNTGAKISLPIRPDTRKNDLSDASTNDNDAPFEDVDKRSGNVLLGFHI